MLGTRLPLCHLDLVETVRANTSGSHARGTMDKPDPYGDWVQLGTKLAITSLVSETTVDAKDFNKEVIPSMRVGSVPSVDPSTWR